MLSLSQLQDATSIDEARQMLETRKYDLRFKLGYGRPSSSLEAHHITQLVTGVCLQQIIYSNKTALDQLLEGLRSHQVNELIAGNFPLAKALFTHTPTVSIDATAMRSLFKFTPSQTGTNARTKEEELLLYWYRFLSDVEDGLVSTGAYIYLT